MDKEKLGESFYKGTINDEALTKANALLVIKCANLEQQCKKQQEVIDKAIEYIEIHKRKDEFLELNEWQTRDLLDLLKEVSK